MKAPLPFLKWAGGKRALLPKILPLVPRKVQVYYEPFLGGGAVFFALAGGERFRRAVVSDANLELIRTYRAVQADVDSVLRRLDTHARTEAHYLMVRDQNPVSLTDAACAARMIFLNRAGFNGLYRLNRLGEFNVPFDRHSASRPFANAARLRMAAAALDVGRVEIRHAGYDEILPGAGVGDFVYLDPPYIPASKTAAFTAYTSASFGPAQHIELAASVRRLRDRQVAAAVSHGDSAIARFLYHGMKIKAVSARRNINRNGAKRGAVGELLVMTTSGGRR